MPSTQGTSTKSASKTFGLWLGLWEGTIDREPATGSCLWLRFYDRDGNLVLLPEEVAQQKLEQSERVWREAIPRLRDLGLSVERIGGALGLSAEEVQRAMLSLEEQ